MKTRDEIRARIVGSETLKEKMIREEKWYQVARLQGEIDALTWTWYR